MSQKTYVTVFSIVGLVVLGAALRMSFWGGRELGFDEIAILNISDDGLHEIVNEHQTDNSAPLFFGLLVRLFLTFLPLGSLARLVSFVPGLLAIPMGYRLGKDFYDQTMGYLLATGLAVHSVFIQYSAYLREYTWVVFQCVLLLWVLQKLLQKPSRPNFVLLGAVCTWMLWTQYGLWLVVGISMMLVLWQLYQWGKLWAEAVVLGAWLVVNAGVVYIVTLRDQLYISDEPYLDLGYSSNLFGILGRTVWLLFFAAGGPGFVVMPVLLWISRKVVVKLILWVVGLTWLGVIVLAMLKKYPYGGIRQDMFLATLIFTISLIGLRYFAIERPRLGVVIGSVLLIGAVGPIVTGSYWINSTDATEITHILVMEEAQSPILIGRLEAAIWAYYSNQPNRLLAGQGNLWDRIADCLAEYPSCWYLVYDPEHAELSVKSIGDKYPNIEVIEIQKAQAILIKRPTGIFLGG